MCYNSESSSLPISSLHVYDYSPTSFSRDRLRKETLLEAYSIFSFKHLTIGSMVAGMDPGFLERGDICIKGLGFALLILSHFS